MYKSKKPYFYGTGRRKSSVARVHLFQNGTGAITINGRDIDDYFGLDTLKAIARQPLALTETEGKFDIVCTLAGGGVAGQAGAEAMADVLLGNETPSGKLNETWPENLEGFAFGSLGCKSG